MAPAWQQMKPALSHQTLRCIDKLGFKTMTPVQAATIPLFMSNKDVATEAVTGSGKTLAFLVPVIEILLQREIRLKKQEVGAIIITPTRELASQINEVLMTFTNEFSQFRQLLLIGGGDTTLDIEKLNTQGGNILICTPGRLEGLLTQSHGALNLAARVRSLEVLVLDEADRLLDMGFEKSINTILGFLPKQRRTGLFSATQTDEVEKLVRAGLRNPVRITVSEKYSKSKALQKTPSMLKNFYLVCPSRDKFSCLVAFLKERKHCKNMVFFSTCAGVNYFAKALVRFLPKVDILWIHGKMKSNRHKTFNEFRKLNSGILICTDVMARGVDIPEVDWVIQYDPPSSATAFVHRCGRTARIGNQGNAVVFLLPMEEAYVEFLAINQKVPLQRFDMPETPVPDQIPKLKKFATKDRDLYEKGMRAFVSFVQSYRKHECSLIFRLKELDLGELAEGFGLLKMPKMPELKGKAVESFCATEVDVDSIPYQDKAREKQRLKRLQEQSDDACARDFKKRRTSRKNSTPWSKSKEREIKREKRKARREFLKKQRKQRHTFNEEDLEDLARDAKLLKQLKRRKISKEEFQAEFIDNNDS